MSKIHLFVLTLGLLLFTGCTPKVAIKSLQAPKVINENTKKMAIIPFENDTIGQSDAIINELNSIYIDGIKYYTLINQESIDTLIQEKKLGNQDSFRVYSGATQAKSILLGKVLTQNLGYHRYTKEKTDYDRCIRYEHKHDKNHKEKKKDRGKCLEYATIYIPCTEQRYDVQTLIQLANIEDSTILFSKTYDAQDSYSMCHDRNYSFPNSNTIFTKLTQKIAQSFMSDITPTYKYLSMETIDELDIEVSSEVESEFEKAIESIQNNNIQFALNTLENLDKKLHNQSIAVLYNLALCKI